MDRSAAYMARYVAKNIVAAGLADLCQLQVAYAIGTAHPVSLAADTFGTEQVDPDKLEGSALELFDFRPAAIIRDLDLARPIYRETAAYGHFGRKEFPWEATDRVDDLRRASGSATNSALSGPVSICVDRPILSLDRPFTYDLPQELEAGIGSLVEISFHGRRSRGWVLGATQDVPARMLPVRKRVSGVSFFDDQMLELAMHLRERYVAPLASVLKRVSPPRVVAEESEEASGAGSPAPGRDVDNPSEPSDLLTAYRGGPALAEAIGQGSGAWSLRPAPEDEVALAVECVRRSLVAGRRAIVLVPEASPVPATAAAIVDAFGERVALFLGGAKRARYRMWLDMRAGRYDVVVGTRPAVFAPLERLGLIYVAREGHGAHREDRSPYFHVRDVALARGRIEGASCVLAALFPSVEAAAAGLAAVEPARRRWPPAWGVRPGPEGRAPRLVAALRDARARAAFTEAVAWPRIAHRYHGLALVWRGRDVCGVRGPAALAGGSRSVHGVRRAGAMRVLRSCELRSAPWGSRARTRVGGAGREGTRPGRAGRSFVVRARRRHGRGARSGPRRGNRRSGSRGHPACR